MRLLCSHGLGNKAVTQGKRSKRQRKCVEVTMKTVLPDGGCYS